MQDLTSIFFSFLHHFFANVGVATREKKTS